jgi:hypothetical protein
MLGGVCPQKPINEPYKQKPDPRQQYRTKKDPEIALLKSKSATSISERPIETGCRRDLNPPQSSTMASDKITGYNRRTGA